MFFCVVVDPPRSAILGRLATEAAVFIKATKTYTDKAGRARKSHRLVRNVPVDDRVRQQMLFNLGTHWVVPRELWLRIARRCEEILAGRQALFPEPEAVEQHAQQLARKLRAKGLGLPGRSDPAVARVDLDSMEHQDPVSVGAERVCLRALEDLGFRRILEGCGLSLRDARIATAIVAARMIHPCSEREASRWLQGDSALPELLGLGVIDPHLGGIGPGTLRCRTLKVGSQIVERRLDRAKVVSKPFPLRHGRGCRPPSVVMQEYERHVVPVLGRPP